jgi:hypothetical protein
MRLTAIALMTLCACSGGDDDGQSDFDAATGSDATAQIDANDCTIPLPGDEQTFDWQDAEPNDTACQAFPSGLMPFAAWMGFGTEPNAINTNDDVDFYVFKTSTADTLSGIFLQVCADKANVFDAFLYNVDSDRHQGDLVVESTTADACQTLVMGNGDTLLAADTDYLLELRAKPGLDLGGEPSLYSA